ncbi:hypothetical protein CFC21_074342 [Triticum aestivum]|uniref:Uncharacterized protein n=2 Tax=Triticum aestivum TaxID=4565 RepID=A0A9R1HP12_WHEAT|nr:uncharacterized protein LOC119306557 [Triticum dicoccoides]XP_044394102.1 uncharacterized protein LOC123117398 [Triticum aestivum]KAF7068603.1 hypothetical protein CFC21_074342 [Triticum aestivum]
MGCGKKMAALASLFGFKTKRLEEEEATAATRQQQHAAAPPQQRYHHHRVRPSDDDDYARHWFAERDIDRKASEFIDKVHRRMLANEQDG